ncbi:MAG: hypothetical protein RL559_496 [Pseudomonadota bacterium]
MMTEKTACILVVEDDAFMAELLRFMFERAQMRVKVLADGRAALDQLAQAPDVDAVVLDWMLPQVSGLDVLLRLRALPAWAKVPVLVLSAQDAGTEVARALEAGANDHVTKPFDPQVLMARLRRLLPAATSGADHAL